MTLNSNPTLSCIFVIYCMISFVEMQYLFTNFPPYTLILVCTIIRFEQIFRPILYILRHQNDPIGPILQLHVESEIGTEAVALLKIWPIIFSVVPYAKIVTIFNHSPLETILCTIEY
jgi:hypothetical protein